MLIQDVKPYKYEFVRYWEAVVMPRKRELDELMANRIGKTTKIEVKVIE